MLTGNYQPLKLSVKICKLYFYCKFNSPLSTLLRNRCKLLLLSFPTFRIVIEFPLYKSHLFLRIFIQRPYFQLFNYCQRAYQIIITVVGIVLLFTTAFYFYMPPNLRSLFFSRKCSFFSEFLVIFPFFKQHLFVFVLSLGKSWQGYSGINSLSIQINFY